VRSFARVERSKLEEFITRAYEGTEREVQRRGRGPATMLMARRGPSAVYASRMWRETRCMKLSRRSLIPLIVVAAVGVGVAAYAPAASSATSPTVYSLTYAGTDAHSLDSGVSPTFVDGGGVRPTYLNDHVPKYHYLEIGLNIPVGAKVTSVAITYSECEPMVQSSLSFGSYQPGTGNTMPLFTVVGKSCGRTTVTKTGAPVTTIAAGRRYVIDDQYGNLATYPGSDEVLYGATVKYTCTAPCVP
jgi:hypothetical protein